MRWCRFQSGRTVTYGIIEETTVTEVTGSPFEGYARTATTCPLSQVKLLVPAIPPTFYAAGVNYREHVTEMAHRRGVKPEFPPNADVGYRANNALIATDEPIVIPKGARGLRHASRDSGRRLSRPPYDRPLVQSGLSAARPRRERVVRHRDSYRAASIAAPGNTEQRLDSRE